VKQREATSPLRSIWPKQDRWWNCHRRKSNGPVHLYSPTRLEWTGRFC